jgi:hypothetical protein
MGWLLAPVIPKKAWPKFKVMDRRASPKPSTNVSSLATDNPEEQTYCELFWESDSSQTDIVQMDQGRVDWDLTLEWIAAPCQSVSQKILQVFEYQWQI